MLLEIKPMSDPNFVARHGQQLVVEVVAAKMRVSIGGEHLVDIAFARGNQLEDGNVERAAAQIVNGHAAPPLFVQSIGQRRSGRLVHQTQNLEPGQTPGVLGRLPLRVVKIRRHGDDGAIDAFAEEALGPTLQLAQDK